MPKKCCVKNCRSNYDPLKDQEKVSVPVFRLPSAKDDQENRDNWINMLNSHDSEVKVSDNTVVCEKHWPRDYRKYRKQGHDRPADPTSIFGPTVADKISGISCLVAKRKPLYSRYLQTVFGGQECFA